MVSYIEVVTVENVIPVNLFGWKFNITYYTSYEITVVKYSYTKPNVGKDGRSVLPNLFAIGGIIVSTVHTHANYNPKYDNENFSKKTNKNEGLGDIDYANLFGMDIYLVTPGGYLKKYTYANRKKPMVVFL